MVVLALLMLGTLMLSLNIMLSTLHKITCVTILSNMKIAELNAGKTNKFSILTYYCNLCTVDTMIRGVLMNTCMCVHVHVHVGVFISEVHVP